MRDAVAALAAVCWLCASALTAQGQTATAPATDVFVPIPRPDAATLAARTAAAAAQAEREAQAEAEAEAARRAIEAAAAPTAATDQSESTTNDPSPNRRIGAGENRRLTREEIAERMDALMGTETLVPIQPDRTVLLDAVRLRQLDKMTGKVTDVALIAGETVRHGRLAIRLDGCRAPEGEARRKSMAYLKVWDTKLDGTVPVFSGWMFAASPALSALDHPRYDLWVISCTTSSGVASVPTE